ncbi:chloroplast RNA-binding protein 33 [Tasmannia lanceolata]|uniref:chloroplast RNA-binding protein 33 n=1 Tax=Tasmannia lanceolata TaxID=3420 RepID=UPI004063C97D
MAASISISLPLFTRPLSPSNLAITTIKFTKLKHLTLNSKTLNCFHLPFLPFSPRTCRSATSDDEGRYQEDEEEEDDDDDGVISGSNEGSRLYVGNLPYSMTSSQLAQVFQEAGTVDSVEVVYDRMTDRSRGFAFVTMGSFDEAKEAIRMFSGSQVGGRSVKVNFPEVPRGEEREVMGPRIRSSYRGFIDSPYKVYAGNVGWNVTSDALREAFAAQSGLLSAKVIYERDTGRSRGFGFVTFASSQEAQSAIDAMNGVEVEGRPLRLNLAAQRGAAPQTETDPQSSAMQSTVGY